MDEELNLANDPQVINSTKDKIRGKIEDFRKLQRAGDFIKLSNKSINIYSTNAKNLFKIDRKKLMCLDELVDDNVGDRVDGDPVTLDDVYMSSKDVIWSDDGAFRFTTKDGAVLPYEQYKHILEHGGILGNRYFAKPNNENKDVTLTKAWTDMCRKSKEAREDKAKSILYLTIGTVKWTMVGKTRNDLEEVVSPLLLCKAKEIVKTKSLDRQLEVIGDSVVVNPVLAGELKSAGIGLFDGKFTTTSGKEMDILSEAIPFGDNAYNVLEAIRNNAERLDVEVDINNINICILDSTNETICQFVEKNIDELSKTPIIQLLLNDKFNDDFVLNYDSHIKRKSVSGCAIYPMPSDDSQREVVESVIKGDSIEISAAAGTGKSHLMSLLACNFAVAGKKICVMSEKRAANEVFVEYAKRIGLDRYCLVLDDNASVTTVIEAIERMIALVGSEDQYVDPAKCAKLLSNVNDVENYFESYNRYLYKGLKVNPNLTLYQLIGDAIVAPPCKNDSLEPLKMEYLSELSKGDMDTLLEDMENDITCNEAEVIRYFETGEIDDDSSDMRDYLHKFEKNFGVKLMDFVRDNSIAPKDFVKLLKANIARVYATRIIDTLSKQDDIDVSSFSGKKLFKKHMELIDADKKMQALYMAYMHQELKHRANAALKEATNLSQISRIKKANLDMRKLFANFGKEIMMLFPIIVTTPSVAVSYINNNMNKEFNALLIDEASQVPIISVLPFLMGDKQLIAFGDDKQLDITSFFNKKEVEDETDEEMEDGKFTITVSEKSILDIVAGKLKKKIQLRFHYRSKTQHLVTPSNIMFYNSALNIVPDVYVDKDKLPSTLGLEVHSEEEPFDPEEARSNQSGTSRKKNPYVIEYEKRAKARLLNSIVTRIIDILEDPAYAGKNIGVVTLNEEFHDTVLDELYKEAEEKGVKLSEDDDSPERVWVRSLENAQGREADIIIVAIDHTRRRLRDGEILRNISGYFNQSKDQEDRGNHRINVLTTRAKEKCIVYLAFDYTKLKDTTAGLGTLYSYLLYADKGEMSDKMKEALQVSRNNYDVKDNVNDVVRAIIKSELHAADVKENIGSGAVDMMVDIATISSDNADKYDMGFLMPKKKTNINTLCTKVNILQNASWRLIPISPIYLLNDESKFRAQLADMADQSLKIGKTKIDYTDYLTTNEPNKLVSLDIIEKRGIENRKNPDDLLDIADPNLKGMDIVDDDIDDMDDIDDLGDLSLDEDVDGLPELSIEDLANINFEEKMRNIAGKYKDVPSTYVKANYSKKIPLFMIMIGMCVDRCVKTLNMPKLIEYAKKAKKFHDTKDKRIGYVYAEIMRATEEYANGDTALLEEVKELLEEAVTLGVIEEVK